MKRKYIISIIALIAYLTLGSLIIKTIVIYNTDELTAEILEHRTNGNKILVERVVGEVINEKDGKILNTEETYYNYISYSKVNFAHKNGDVVVSYFVYNPFNNEIDDTLLRFDFKVK